MYVFYKLRSKFFLLDCTDQPEVVAKKEAWKVARKKGWKEACLQSRHTDWILYDMNMHVISPLASMTSLPQMSQTI